MLKKFDGKFTEKKGSYTSLLDKLTQLNATKSLGQILTEKEFKDMLSQKERISLKIRPNNPLYDYEFIRIQS